MALPFIIRSTAKPEALQNLLRFSSIIVKNAAYHSQLSCQPKSINLAQKCLNLNVIKPSIKYRNISLTAPRKSAHGDHRMIWTIERGLSVALLGLVPATFLMPNALFDNLLAISVVAHQHWGLEACVIDYIRPIIFGPAIPKLALGALYLVSFATLGGLLYFNYNDIGIGRAVRKFWRLKPTD